MNKNKKFEGIAEGEPVPELVAPLLYLYARHGDSHHRYPYVWVIDYDVIDSDYERLKEALKEHNYWKRFVQKEKLKIRCVRDGYIYAFKDRPVVYVRAGDVYVERSEYEKNPPTSVRIYNHGAALTVSILNDKLGLVRGYRRERRPMTEEELAEIP